MKKDKNGFYNTSFTYRGEKYHLTGKSKQAIEHKKEIIIKEYEHSPKGRKCTCRELSESWLNTIESASAYRTYEMYKNQIKKIDKHIGSLYVRLVRTADLQEIINDNLEHPRTCQLIKLTLNRMFNYAIDNELIIRNPAKSLTLPKHKAKEKRALSSYEKDKIQTLEGDAKLFCSILYYTGIRRGECLALKKEDFKNGFLRVDKAVSYKDNTPYIKTPKTANSVRTIPVPVALQDMINNCEKKGYLFGEDKPLTKSQLRNLWDKIKKEIDTDITPHIFRHNYASMLYDSGVDAKEAQRLLGHSSISVTLDIYTHLSDDTSSKRLDLINQVFK